MLAMQLRMSALEAGLKKNTELCEAVDKKADKIEKNTADLVAIFRGAKAVVKGAETSGNFVKWCSGVTASIAALYILVYTILNGHPPW